MNDGNYTIGIDASNAEGGAITNLTEMFYAMPSSNYRNIKFVVWGKSKFKHAFENKSNFEFIECDQITKSYLARIKWGFFTLPEQVKRKKIDNLFVLGGFFFRKACCVTTICQNMLPFQYGEMLRFFGRPIFFKFLILRLLHIVSFNRSDGVIFLSDFAKQKVVNNIFVNINSSCIIPHGIKKEFFKENKGNVKSDKTLENKIFNIVYVSTIDLYKHQDKVVSAISELRDNGHDIRIDFFGSSYLPALEKLRMQLSKVDPDSSWARYHGLVKYEDLPARYENYDFSIFASSCENLPNVVLEIMASGLPLLSSNMGPMPDVIKDGGIYFNPLSVEDIKEKVLEGINNPIKLHNKSIIAQQIASNYSWDSTAKETIAYLIAIVDRAKLNLE